MRMVTEIAVANMKYYKSKNILTGIAIFLTTLLLFLVPAVGYDMIQSDHALTNELFPTFHALYREVPEETVKKLSVHHSVSRWGLRSDLGYMAGGDASIAMLYMDAEGFDMYHLKLSGGRLPEAENEIVVSEGILGEISQSGGIGDTITVPYQVFRDGGLDYIQEREFVICGFTGDTEQDGEQKEYYAFISRALLEKEIPPEQISYRFLFRVAAESSGTTDNIEAKIDQLAGQFGISEQFVRVNDDYLEANYVDPAVVPVIVMVMLIVVAAGVITIYSIYYVSMEGRVQEFGRIKAIGATKKQLCGIVLLEGLAVAGIAVPLGLLCGTALTKGVFIGMFEAFKEGNEYVGMARELVLGGSIPLYHLWVYVLAAGVAVATVCLSLLSPMRAASGVSEIEAIRYRDGRNTGKEKRKGYQNLSVGRLAMVYLGGNKKKSAVTVCSMAATGLFFMVVATVLSCADPVEGTNFAMMGEYEISPVVETGNREHPELEWSEVQKDNPLTGDLRERILQIEGITSVECFSKTYIISDSFDDVVNGGMEWVIGVPESSRKQLEDGIIDGNVTYEQLTAGDKVIMDRKMLYFFPGLKLGDTLDVTVEDGSGTHKRQLTIAAIGDYPLGFESYSYLLMAQEGLETFSENNLNYYYHVFAEKTYDAGVEGELDAIVEESGRLRLRVWKDIYEENKSGMALMRGVCYAFLGILGAICIMNMVNTMIHSVHVRKKEIGMLQALGMSDAQMRRMLGLEGLFYTAGTLLIAVGGGSLAGYPVFLWMKKEVMFDITNYHYPAGAALTVVLVLAAVQTLLTLALGKSMKKESLIDRIRFDN